MVQSVKRFKTMEELNEAMVNFLLNYFKRDKPIFTFCLSGGNSPRKLYERIALERDFPWEKIHIFLGDERYVPYDSPLSNYGMIHDSLIKRIRIPRENVHMIRTDLPIEEAAKDYESTLRKFFDDENPTFDVLFLGMGKDGHTASIFPGSPLMYEEKKWVAWAEARLDPFVKRITLTFPLLNRSSNTFILAGGREKSSLIDKFFYPKSDYPVAMVRSEHLEIMIYEE